LRPPATFLARVVDCIFAFITACATSIFITFRRWYCSLSFILGDRQRTVGIESGGGGDSESRPLLAGNSGSNHRGVLTMSASAIYESRRQTLADMIAQIRWVCPTANIHSISEGISFSVYDPFLPYPALNWKMVMVSGSDYWAHHKIDRALFFAYTAPAYLTVCVLSSESTTRTRACSVSRWCRRSSPLPNSISSYPLCCWDRELWSQSFEICCSGVVPVPNSHMLPFANLASVYITVLKETWFT